MTKIEYAIVKWHFGGESIVRIVSDGRKRKVDTIGNSHVYSMRELKAHGKIVKVLSESETLKRLKA